MKRTPSKNARLKISSAKPNSDSRLSKYLKTVPPGERKKAAKRYAELAATMDLRPTKAIVVDHGIYREMHNVVDEADLPDGIPLKKGDNSQSVLHGINGCRNATEFVSGMLASANAALAAQGVDPDKANFLRPPTGRITSQAMDVRMWAGIVADCLASGALAEEPGLFAMILANEAHRLAVMQAEEPALRQKRNRVNRMKVAKASGFTDEMRRTMEELCRPAVARKISEGYNYVRACERASDELVYPEGFSNAGEKLTWNVVRDYAPNPNKRRSPRKK